MFLTAYPIQGCGVGAVEPFKNNNRIIEIGNNNHLRYCFFNEKFVMGNCFILSKSLFVLLWVCQDWNSGVCDWLIYWVWCSISLPKPVGFINFSVMTLLNAGLYDTNKSCSILPKKMVLSGETGITSVECCIWKMGLMVWKVKYKHSFL